MGQAQRQGWSHKGQVVFEGWPCDRMTLWPCDIVTFRPCDLYDRHLAPHCNIHSRNLSKFQGHINSKQIPLEASFSPDSQFVISGSTDGRVHIWNAENGTKVCVLNGDHTGPVQCVQFNPKVRIMSFQQGVEWRIYCRILNVCFDYFFQLTLRSGLKEVQINSFELRHP